MDKERIRVWVQRFPDRANLVLQWHDPATGRRRSESAKTADEAEAEQKARDKECLLNLGLSRDPNRTTWEAFRGRFWEEYVEPARPNTRKNYRTVLDLFEELAGVKRMDQVTASVISQFANKLRRRPGNRGRKEAMPSTVKQRLDLLQAALNWAREQGMLAAVPKFPEVKVPRKKPKPVSPDHFEALLAAAGDDAQMRAYLLCGWLAGLRLEEAFLLSWGRTEQAPWLDLAGNRIVLPAEMVKAVEDQWVPLDPLLKEVLLALPRAPGRDRVFHFTDTRPGRRGRGLAIKPSAMVNRVVRLARKAGVPLTMHALRRGFGCRYAGQVPAQVLQRLMRHSNIAVTLGYYANVDDAVMAAVLGPRRNGERNSGAETDKGVGESSTQGQPGQGL